MITFPCAKINLGLNIVGIRDNGYHDIETVFFPIPITDKIEIHIKKEYFSTNTDCSIELSGQKIAGNTEDNLVVKAYHLLKKDFQIPPIKIKLDKYIPTQAGLGGGSSDAAHMLKLLNDLFLLHLDTETMQHYAAQLGADCAVFIKNTPAFATGMGEILHPMPALTTILNRYFIAIVKPDVAVSTKEAYQQIKVSKPKKSCNDIVAQPIETWKEDLINDFEVSVFQQHPILKNIKQQLYQQGAIYASMSGSGSALYGLFEKAPKNLNNIFSDCFIKVISL